MKSFIPILLAAPLLRGAQLLAADSAAAPSTQMDTVIVTASPLGGTAYDQAQPVSVLTGKALKLRLAPTLGETLSGEPGVSSSYFTAGASRPIIRGLSDNRVRVLNNGTEVFDVSNLSPDHAPSVSTILSQSIEVVRGPATILYGSGAIGGLVNVVDNRIPVEIPPLRFSGELDARFNSANLERSGAAIFNLALTDHIVLHLDGSILRTDSVAVPGYALAAPVRATLTPQQQALGNSFGGNPWGIVPNTQVFTRDAAAGLSYVGDRGFFGVAFSQFLSEYGVPDDPEVDEPGVPPVPVHLDVRRRQFSLHGSLKDPLPGFASADLKFAYTNYRHDEIDGQVIGSTFKTSGIDSRLEFVQQPISVFTGVIGAQVLYKQLSVLGDEAFLQPTKTTELAAFVFEEAKLGQVRLQVGARLEYVAESIDTDNPELTSLTSSSQQQRDFLPVSVALGGIWDFAENYALALTGSYSQRAPTPEELYARGPHDATFQFIVGDPNLPVERALGVDLSLRKKAGVITGNLSAFYNRFTNFIDFNGTNVFIDGLQVFDYTPVNAEFFGGEALVAWHLLPLTITVPAAHSDPKGVKGMIAKETVSGDAPNPNDLYLEARGDCVYARNLDSGDALPRITPPRFTGALVYQGAQLGSRVEVQYVSPQNRVSEFETTTAGYTFLNASVDYTFGTGRVQYDLYVRGTNLTNAQARDNESFLKEVLPLPGRSVAVGLKMSF